MTAPAPQCQPTTEHTPPPWEWDSGIIPPDGPHKYCDVYVDGGDTIIANVNDCIPQGKANAAFIVTAVNSHAALTDRVKELEKMVKEQGQEIAVTRERDEALESLLERCGTVLGNMALENETGLGAIFNRWPISHEPLRSDAKNLVPLIDAALQRGGA